MKLFGLIGYPLSHSFSKKYFTEKFKNENIKDAYYELFEIEKIEYLKDVLIKNPQIKGLNVTIPHKQSVIPYLDSLDVSAKKVKAVNVIKILSDGKKVGFNSDYYGFKVSLENWLKVLERDISSIKAIVLGTGGASKAVQAALIDLNISFILVSRVKTNESFTYEELNAKILNENHLVINTSPVGMHPKTEEYPLLNYNFINNDHLLYDLVYNPPETSFMKLGKAKGAQVKNGLEMLHAQAEKAWEIWNID